LATTREVATVMAMTMTNTIIKILLLLVSLLLYCL